MQPSLFCRRYVGSWAEPRVEKDVIRENISRSSREGISSNDNRVAGEGLHTNNNQCSPLYNQNENLYNQNENLSTWNLIRLDGVVADPDADDIRYFVECRE